MFAYWLSQISFGIAASITLDDKGVDFDLEYNENQEGEDIGANISIPNWYQYLASRRWQQGFLSNVQAAAGVFHPDIPRVGIFLDITNPKRNQYSVDWFTKFHVPVWYPWGTTEINAAAHSTSLARLAPPVHQLQMATTFISKPVSTGTHSGGGGKGDLKYWNEWLADRLERESQILAGMSDSDRRAMEDRKRQPPKKKCRIFVWRKQDNGAFSREPVTSRENSETLAEFGRKQKIYSAIFNEWDCCEEMGAMEEDEDDMEDWSGDPEDRILPTGINLTLPNLDNDDDSNNEIFGTIAMERPPSYSDTHQFDLHRYEAPQMLREYYGFVAPLPLLPIDDSETIAPATRSIFFSIIGLRGRDEEFFQSDIVHHAIRFLDSFAEGPGYPSDDAWDLASDNRLCIRWTERFRQMEHLLNKGDGTSAGFLFRFGFKQTVPWLIFVKDPVNALLVCRLDESLNDYGVAFALLQRGIEFSTVLLFTQAEHLRAAPNIRTLPLPVRLHGYEFTTDDYTLYVQARNRLLKNPRIGRAALLLGGIVWRLAVEHVSFSTALLGPTASVLTGSKHANDDTNMFLGDDICTQREIDLICGAVVCTSNDSRRASIKYWWPPHSSWIKWSTQLHWTATYERFFHDRLQKLQSGTAGPLTASEWKSKIRPAARSRAIKRNFEQHSLDAIEKLQSM
ncbi:hypothetical protein BJ912DRAFT_854611 [Pholiota molesta]|nr:hypothetical protein BJ912DRAFT_854611 [Pholiota molesta]